MAINTVKLGVRSIILGILLLCCTLIYASFTFSTIFGFIVLSVTIMCAGILICNYGE